MCIALITAGAFVAIPIPGSPVPIVLQNMFVVFTGLVLSPLWAMLTVGVYLVLGAAGLPIFAGAAGGLAHFAGPTGGFLLGYVPAAGLTSLLLRVGRDDRRTAREAGLFHQVLAIVPGFLIVYALGVPRLAVVTGLSISRTFWIGMAPFLPGDVIKTIALVILLRSIPGSIWRSWS